MIDHRRDDLTPPPASRDGHICLPKYWRPDRGEVCWCGAPVGRRAGAEVVVLNKYRRQGQ